MYMTVKEAAEKWGISDRRVRILCAEGKIPGAYRQGRGWKIPANVEKPADGRYKPAGALLVLIDQKKKALDSRRPLTAGEVERLIEEFTVEYTYNSNAIEGNTLTLRETDLVLRGLTIDQKPLKDHMEAVGHKEAFDFVRELVQSNAPLSEHVIQQIHYLVLADKRE
ncbi:MAG: helix-turn-helix domain-containing protein, partial [Clostridia bacterium]|nr:helix-turn-helix domain-containing protein [Clostridia bacterium]